MFLEITFNAPNFLFCRHVETGFHSLNHRRRVINCQDLCPRVKGANRTFGSSPFSIKPAANGFVFLCDLCDSARAMKPNEITAQISAAISSSLMDAAAVKAWVSRNNRCQKGVGSEWRLV